MPRRVRDAKIETRSARAKLRPQGKPYYRSIVQGLHLGYRKGLSGGRWVIRYYTGKQQYTVETLPGIADDIIDANGVAILNFDQAQEAARTIYTSRKSAAIATTPYTVEQACRDYVGYLAKHKKTAVDAERRLNRLVIPVLGKRLVGELSQEEIEDWQANLIRRDPDNPEIERKSKDTANRELGILRAALNKAYENEKSRKNRGITSADAWREVKPFEGVGRPRTLALGAAQCQRLINSTSGAFRNLVISILLTGSRPAPGEVAQARVRDFHHELGVINLSGKTGERSVPLTDEAVAWFKSLAAGKHPDALLLPRDDGTPWRTGNQTPFMVEARTCAKLPKETTLYSLRHTFASQHIMGGTDLKTLADIMGTSVRMLEEHYAHILASHKRKAVEAAKFSLGTEPSNVTQLGSGT
jgi:integrase